MSLAFVPATGLLDTVEFPTTPATETAARQQFMTLFYQVRDYINTAETARDAEIAEIEANWKIGLFL